ncbi:P-loop containing nucleoside triphosphate hydrolase protein [Thermothelomyces heterothallicus CBS 202.75]|uniref:P-loop containing nucleoside triphosphate hydrolase protein n=1 Tax=Thermothelomyces heterothallicus CBS 202.75 TaxID=1149848 RepID=UPI0037433FAF
MNIIGTDANTQSAIDIVREHVFFNPKGRHDWQSKPEFPTAAEILATQSDIDELPENPVDVPWSSKEDYLAAQYEILRREATEGLRYSVRSFADHRRKESMMDDDFTNIYTQVRVKEYVMSTIGPLARVSFSTERSRYRIQWQQSKRLQPGKIVALSPKSDSFKKICKIATIAQRPYKNGLDRDPPVVDLVWANPEDAVLDPHLELIMIESLHGYFESARHSLVGLQHAARTDSPLDKYLTGAYTSDTHPEFLKENPITDHSTLVTAATSTGSEGMTEWGSYDIVNGDLPDLKDLSFLDESQLLGLHRIISKELAIVQGPPGTGKTYTSVEALRVLVANRRRRRGPPILVAAQTNHALDQILIHCVRAGTNVLRIGGRTQSDLIKPYTLYEVRQKCGRNQIPADNKCRSIDARRQENVRKIQELVDSLFSNRLLDPQTLLDFGIITADQYSSLCDESMETHEAINEHGPFALWLGDSLIPARIRDERHPTQLELSEAEARKNLPECEWEDEEDIENIAYDEEDELYRLRGPVIPLKHVWSGKDPANLTSWDRAVARALRNQDLFSIDRDLRGAVYQHFQARLLDAMTPKFAALIAENVDLCKQRKAFKFLGNAQLVDKQRIDIVGCTTTGLTKYRGCLAAMQPQSLLIEEAAETREANIVSALYPSIQQLILVGDHKQLAPKCDILRLGDAPYNLNVSLFQRMVNLNMPFVMLKQQRRMKPELRCILEPFYPELYDHPSVESINHRPDVLGMGGRNSWLFDHTWPEDVNSDFSKFNEREAEMITNFFAYLVANGTPSERITVLTFYKGQCKVLLRKLKRHPSIMGSIFNVCTVDSYQGEENDIILLSLVRSPQFDRAYAVGFLEDERRAVVAISRARRGFYVFGNVENVLGAHQASHDLWYKICSGFAKQGRIQRERGLPLVCQPHNREIWIKEVEDWGDNSGGCDWPCKQTRNCSHFCALKCHALPHDVLPCGEPCREKLECGHGCQKLCGQKCFCDCKEFDMLTGPTQTAVQSMSLMDKMRLMGAEETEMFKLNSRSAIPQPFRSVRKVPVPEQPGLSSGNGNGRHTQPLMQTIPIQTAQSAARWGDYAKSLKEEHELLTRHNHLATAQPRRQEIVVNDVYQPTTLADGKRVGRGSKPGGWSGNGQSAMLSSERVPRLPVIENKPPDSVPPKHHEGKASRKSPANTALQEQNDPPQQAAVPQHLSVRHTTTQHAPIRLPGVQLDLLTDPLPSDTSPPGEMHPANLPGHAVISHSCAQIEASTPTPSTTVNGCEAPLSEILGPYQAPAQAQVPACTQDQVNEDGQLDGGVQDADCEDWLIVL